MSYHDNKEFDARQELIAAAEDVAEHGTSRLAAMTSRGFRLRRAVDKYREAIGEDPIFGEQTECSTDERSSE